MYSRSRSSAPVLQPVTNLCNLHVTTGWQEHGNGYAWFLFWATPLTLHYPRIVLHSLALQTPGNIVASSFRKENTNLSFYL